MFRSGRKGKVASSDSRRCAHDRLQHWLDSLRTAAHGKAEHGGVVPLIESEGKEWKPDEAS